MRFVAYAYYCVKPAQLEKWGHLDLSQVS